jgi:hypothetical protein
MGAIGAAVAGGVASAAIGTAGSALMGGKASGGAGQAQQLASQQRNDLMPWVGSGGLANTASADLLGLNGPEAATAAMGNFRTSPGYQFQMDQGLRAVDAGAAAKGLLRSGSTLKAEQAFGAGLADSDFQQYYKNLMGLSTLGESAAAGGASTANVAGTLAQGAGNTEASIYGGAAKALGDTAYTALNNPAVKNQLFGPPSPYGGFGNSYTQY